MTSLQASLDSCLPSFLWANCVEPVVIRGWAFQPRQAMQGVSARIDGQTVPSVVTGIERSDVFEKFCHTHHRSAHARWSGYVVAGLVGPLPVGSSCLELTLTIANGREISIERRGLPVRTFERPEILISGEPRVVIAMATFNPTPHLFAAQIASIRVQTYPDWVCIVCDDGSTPRSRDEIRASLRDDPRFILVENEERLGFYRNFERALALVPQSVRYVALADQDDHWYPHKIDRQVKVLDSRSTYQMVASDARLVDSEGSLLSATFYEQRIPTHDDPYSLFLVNSLIGASMLFRRDLLDAAIPFPRAFPNMFHDHWLARVALSRVP